ncbi:hypothetical protein BDW66DRAFT_155511 [Aspergillus desertorum]
MSLTLLQELWILPTLFGNHYDWTLDAITKLDNGPYHFYAPLSGSPPGANSREQFLLDTQPGGLLIGGWAGRREPNEKNMEHHRVYQDAVADHFKVVLESVEDASRTSNITHLQATLTRCLPLFPNLRAVGLKETYNRDPVAMEERQRMRNKPTGAPDYEARPNFSRYFYTAVLQSRVFTSLMIAVGTTNTRVEILQATGLMADDGLSITQDEEDALGPVMHGIRRLSIHMCSAHVQEIKREKLQRKEQDRPYELLLQSSAAQQPRPNTNPNRLLHVLTQAGPSLESVHLACPGGEYGWLCEP